MRLPTDRDKENVLLNLIKTPSGRKAIGRGVNSNRQSVERHLI